MFSMTIVDTDAFLEMPPTSQLLYFHLSMRADDDGFVGSHKRIMRMMGAGDDDFKILVAKRFILVFESGVVVIKHWLIHNTLRGDRYTETTYKREKALLAITENRSYTEIGCGEFKKIETPKKPCWQKKRENALKSSELPYSFSYKIKEAFWGKNCPICGIVMDNSKTFSKKCIPSIQHNNPISKGGKHELGNISVICHNCNISYRDNKTEELNAKEVINIWNEIQSATNRQRSKEKKSIKENSISAKAEVDKSDKLLDNPISDSKEKKKTKKPAEPAAEEPKFDGKEYIEKMFKDPQKHIRIIALFLTAKKIVPENKKQMDGHLKRNFRAASDLSGYDGNKIREVMIFLRDFSLKMNIPKWTLETVGKYIDEDLEQMKKTVYQQNKLKEQRIFGENIKI
jgi:hypothetical protein